MENETNFANTSVNTNTATKATLLTNPWEELRSALNYYQYVHVFDEPNTLYQTLTGFPSITSERIALYKGIFSARFIDLDGATVERVSSHSNSEMYKLHTRDYGTLGIEVWGEPSYKILLPAEVTPSALLNWDAWDKEMCFYDADNDVAAIGIDMFAFDYTAVGDLNDFKRQFTMNGKKPDWWMLTGLQNTYAVPAFFYHADGTITLDVLDIISGTRLTYGKVKPILSEDEKIKIHNFVSRMKTAYQILYEPDISNYITEIKQIDVRA